MANPSLKNGYISIAHELVEKFAEINIPGNEMRLIWVLWRKTWGWTAGAERKKDWDIISLSQFEKGTKMKHANVAGGLKSLVVKRLLLKGNKGYKFNQNYEEWVVCKRLPSMQKTTTPSMQKTTKSSSQKHTHNRKKERVIEKDPAAEPAVSMEIPEIIKSFEAINPACKRHYGIPTQRNACQALIDTYGFEKVQSVIQKTLPRTNKISFLPTITTPYQLFEKWSALEAGIIKIKNKAGTEQEKKGFTYT